MAKPPRPIPTVLPALTVRNRLGRILDEVEANGRSLVIEKRGSPKAVLLSVKDYIRLAAPEPEILKRIGEASVRRGTDTLTMPQIDRLIARTRKSRRRAAS